MTTDTPRTDAARERYYDGKTSDWVHYTICGMIERELAISLENQCKAQAEVARLNHQLLKTESNLLQSQDINSFLDTEFRIACKRAEKAEAQSESRRQSLAFALNETKKIEAEVARLTEKLTITEDELSDAREWLDERYKATSEADERAEKAEAEVERLKSDKAHLITYCANLLEAANPW
jgi:chromosome segregation ATPase